GGVLPRRRPRGRPDARVLRGADDGGAEADAALVGIHARRREAHAVDALAEENKGRNHHSTGIRSSHRPRLVVFRNRGSAAGPSGPASATSRLRSPYTRPSRW